MVNKPETQTEIPAFPFDAHRFYPQWLLQYTDDLIDSPREEQQEEGYELLDLYDEFGDEVLELIAPESPRQVILVDPNQLILACFV